MSHKSYDLLWRATHELLTSIVESEPQQADVRQQRKQLATLYLRYITAANGFTECVDQIVQPQKRILISKLLTATLGRICELKSDLVEADLNEYTHCGDVLDSLKLTPRDVDLIIPNYFRLERKEELDYRKGIIDSVLEKLGLLHKIEVKTPLSEQQAILLLQTHERARQGRLRAQFMKEIKNLKERNKPQQGEDDEESEAKISLPAALCIQKVWRGYQARRATRKKKIQEMLLIGMIPNKKKNNEELMKSLQNMDARRKLQEIRKKHYEAVVVKCKNKLEKHQRALVLEQLSDQVRSWLYEYREQTGKIPDYTVSERSTSRMLISRQGTGTDSELSKSTQISSKESKKSKKSKDIKEEIEEETAPKTSISMFLPELNFCKEEYEENWKNKDESQNPNQYHYLDIIENEQMENMENDLRKVVDEMMRVELQLLQEALDRDRGHKKIRKSSKKSKRSSKKSKKKKEKDLTPDRTTESLFEELIANGIIKRYPEVFLKDFIGERSYHTAVPHNTGKDPKVFLGDIRQILAEFCIIPMLHPQLHDTTPHIKSLLLAGSEGSGKDFLVHAICNEIGATLFDLTPANIVGKYPGKSGLIMLLHLVMKVARLMQPSIIFMDNAEKPFMKKVPKSDKSDPKRLKKDLPKIIKNFDIEDRIIFIGVTNCPWNADQKLLQQVYQKFIFIPRPEYSSRFAFWNQMLQDLDGISWHFNFSGVSRISDGYTIGVIMSALNEVLTVKRKLQLRVKPLNPLEIINALAKRVPVYKEEDEAMANWWMKTPMCKRRTKAIESLIEMEEEMKAKQANAKRK
ncbi:PREDICTED: IQ and AAA domain-containing protein 1 [Nicrophorus vespilloides]|uniref:IQ and AAA domain-containing protein 1 n=1 Tax=Nicrophorus vespilloides TaxID=110193 RepID=A0ABM1MSN1_NICVS|nr:PREDICTED: IQ and AAA domain-containing protein 1 [Nicrophorus vespilloides]